MIRLPRTAKVRVGTETDKRKAELFNKADFLIIQGNFEEAIEDLNYLLRNNPSIRTQVQKKLAYIYLIMEEPMNSMAYIQDLLPSNDFFVNSIVIKNLLLLDRIEEAILFLARSQLRTFDKEKLLTIISDHNPRIKDLLKRRHKSQEPITLNCPFCFDPMFFLNGKLLCLKCKK